MPQLKTQSVLRTEANGAWLTPHLGAKFKRHSVEVLGVKAGRHQQLGLKVPKWPAEVHRKESRNHMGHMAGNARGNNMPSCGS